jgi:hypothetical protein
MVLQRIHLEKDSVAHKGRGLLGHAQRTVFETQHMDSHIINGK